MVNDERTASDEVCFSTSDSSRMCRASETDSHSHSRRVICYSHSHVCISRSRGGQLSVQCPLTRHLLLGRTRLAVRVRDLEHDLLEVVHPFAGGLRLPRVLRDLLAAISSTKHTRRPSDFSRKSEALWPRRSWQAREILLAHINLYLLVVQLPRAQQRLPCAAITHILPH